MSTLVKNEDNYLPQWIEYHKRLGIQRFVIYDNKDSNAPGFDDITHDNIRLNKDHIDLQTTLKKYIDEGTVILILWPYPYVLKDSGGMAQIIQQNHSIYAFSKSKYIGFFDVDEYINPQGFSSIESVFEHTIKSGQLDRTTIDSFSLRNRWFYNPFEHNASGHDFLYIDNCDHITKEGHEKSFVIPKNVDAYSVHHTTVGKTRVWVDPEIMRFNHYCYLNKKERGLINKSVYDNTITSHLDYLGENKNLVMFLNGGLGNQMFQIASAYSIAKSQNKNLVVRNVLGTYHSSVNYFENIFRKVHVNNDIDCEWYREPEQEFTKRLDIPFFQNDILLFGFFQNENYFLHNRKEILEMFQIEIDREKHLGEKYPSCKKGAFIHYRRGDYLNNPNYNLSTDGYYKRGIQKMLHKHDDAVFFVFSDDLPYCRTLDYLLELPNVVFVEENDVDSLYLMSKCFYGGIAANSSYSWWGGWLNTNDDKFVVYPDKWLGNRDDLEIWWKGSFKMKDRPKNYFLTFGGGPMHFLDAVDRICKQAESLEIFDHIYGFKENDLKSDPDFWGKHREFILIHPRGFGHWIWKSYFIKKVMEEAQDDDIIVYCDCGNELDIRKKEQICGLFNVAQKDLLIGTFPSPERTPYLDEIRWNKRDLLYYFNIERNDPILSTNQRQANPLIIYKNDKTMKFVNEWYQIGVDNNHFLNDFPSYTENYPDFIEHRHDQSIFSLLSKRYNLFSETLTEGIIDTPRNRSGVSELT